MNLVRPFAVGASVGLAVVIANYTVPNVMNATGSWQYLLKFLLGFGVALIFYGAYYFLIERPISRRLLPNEPRTEKRRPIRVKQAK